MEGGAVDPRVPPPDGLVLSDPVKRYLDDRCGPP